MTVTFIIPGARQAPGPEVYEWFRRNWGENWSMRGVKDNPKGGYDVALMGKAQSVELTTRRGSRTSTYHWEQNLVTFHLRREGPVGPVGRWMVEGPTFEEAEARRKPLCEKATAELKERIAAEEKLFPAEP